MSSFYNWLDEQEKKKKKQTSTQTQTKSTQSKKSQSFYDWLDENGYESPDKSTTAKDDDIAPVKKTEERKWFDTSVFDDGFQWSDIPKAVVGTSTDVKTNLWSGILGIGEKILDAGMMFGTAMNQGSMMQAAQSEMLYNTISGKDVDAKTVLSNYQKAQDEVEKSTGEFVAKDLYDEEKIARKIISDPVKKLTGIDSETDSLLGEKSDSIVQSGGQLIAQLGADAILPGSGMALMATTAFGSEAESAFRNDAAFDEAFLSATISAGAEVLTERLGGISFGGKTLTDAAFEQMSRKMTSKIAKALITSGKVATDMTAEGAEEILSGYISAIGQKLTYMEDKEIEELFSKEDMLESFIGGAVLGGAGAVGGVVQANAKGVDYVTGLTKNEQSVAQKVYESELAEKEKSGKLSAREKNKLYDKVLKDMELGRIDTDTIESVLGGESYSGYQSMVEQETAIKDEIEALENTPESQFTVKQRERLTELREQLKGIDTKTAKNNLFDEVANLTANDTKLQESYLEKSRRGFAFEADLTKYDTKQQETIKKAVESGILNNTNRTHEFVDFVAKVSADTGVSFDFTNNQKLKESGFAIDGKQVNGYVTKDGITVNVNSAKSLDTVVGHEITHVLEGTELYNELQTAIVKYAKDKGDYQGRYDALAKLYENIEGANIDTELTAELVGDYIFTDTDFIHNLSTNNRNVFQKIYDEIKYLYKVATAGSKEARELERIKKVFDEAYRNNEKAEITDTKYSISGTNAKTADNSLLMKAENMIGEGVDSETVRQETGWYKGYDGQWRFEISDQDMDFNINGHFTNPDVIRHRELEYKFLTEPENITDAEIAEMRSLSNALEGVKKRPSTLGEYLKHDKLFEAYPELKDIKLSFDKLESGVSGKYKLNQNEIVLDNSIRDDVEKIKSTLIHEIQHAIQRIEGFASGSSPKYWESKGIGEVEYESFVENTRREKARILRELSAEERQDYLRYIETDKQIQEILGMSDTFDSMQEDSADALEAIEEENDALYKKLFYTDWFSKLQDIDNILSDGVSEKLYNVFYKNTAGEIEARDTANRLSLNEDQRRNTRPDIDRKNVVLANAGEGFNYIGETKDGRRVYSSGFGDDVGMADRISEFKNRIATIFNLGAVELKTDVKKIRIRGDRFTAQKNLYGDKMGQATEQEAKVNSLYDLADILATSKYDPSATAKEPSYDNPALKPKNKAHEGVKYWYKFRNEIVFDGVPYTVTFNIRDKGGEQYQYLIDFKENKTPGLSNTAVKSLLRADSVSFDDTVAPMPENVNGQFSLSENDAAPKGKFLGKDIALETAPVAETKTEVAEADVAPVAEAKVEDYTPGESLEEQLAKADDSLERLDRETETLFRDLSVQNITEEEFAEKWKDLDNRFTQARQEQERLSAEMTDINNRKYESLDDSDIPPEAEAPYYGDEEYIAPVDQTGERDADPFAKRDMYEVGKRNVKSFMSENPEVKPFFENAALGMLSDLQNGTKGERIFNEKMHYESGYVDGWMGTKRRTTDDIANLLDQWGYTYDQIEAGLNAIIEGNGKENNAVSKRIEFMLDNRLRKGYKDVDGRPIPADEGYINLLNSRESLDRFMEVADQYAPPEEDIAPVKAEAVIEGEQNVLGGFEQVEQEQPKQVQAEQAEQAPERLTRAKLHSKIVENVKAEFARKGLDFDEVLKNAKRMHTLSTNDNTPQRVNDKTFGYEAGEALNELTFNRVALRESEGIKWLNEQVDTLRKLSKKYDIKPRSKESAAAQMYAEGFWVNEKDEIIAYGDAELAKDFPDAHVQNRIKALAKDPTIRKIYDDTLSAINESRTRNAYPEIPRLENYYLHFRAMEDTFSQLGVPFNPEIIKARDLPTDINGTTIDRKPGQPFFTSAFKREGKRTSFDMFDGLERYLNSAKNQIYHIDDIQTARALWSYIADKYGQAHGLENLDHMGLEAQVEQIQKVYNGHLSTYARFLNEYANNLAGKTAILDRALDGEFGRRLLQFAHTVNTQVGRNQVGYSISSPLTNFIPAMEAIARTSKRDSIKAFAQTVSNVFRKDGFVENDPTLIRRKGADKFSKTLWEKMSDPGYILMGAVDNVTSEFIVRTKYNELTRKGMDSEQAHIKAGEWASRIMGDRSYGQMPLHYNSKMLGLFTKYQLEVRNALDSQFYDTYQEAKASTKDIENQKEKNALTATKFAYRAVQIATLNHVFGMAFEKIAGYNPAFDIISTIATLFGWDDDEDDEDTFGDNAEQAFKELLGDLPYTSLFTDGGRIPIGSAMPIKQLVSGVDKYGNEKARWETALEALPYYVLPGGYGQIKKTTQGLGMFSDEHPVSGSYTDSGNLRFPVEKTFGNVLKAGVFGQYASENARDYFDNERSPLKEKQIQEYIDLDIPIKDYWDYREGLAKLKTNEDKVDYIDSLDLPLSKKNILVNNVLDRKNDVDLANYSDYGSLEEFDFATKNPEKYQFFEEIGISYDKYKLSGDDAKDAYNWAFENPEKYTVAKAVSDDVVEYRSYTKGLNDIKADKDEDGKSITGSRKEKVISYIESLPIDYGQKCILFKSEYKADDSMNMDIIEYLDSREDIDYDQMVTILRELDFTVEGNNVYWD